MQPSFDVPAQTHTETLGQSELASGPIERRCRSYAGFAVIEVVDPGRKGAQQISVRPSCTAGPEKTLAEPESYVWGVAGAYVLLQGADGLGLLSPFSVYDGRTGARVFEGSRDSTQPFDIVRAGGRIRLEYAASLASPCALAQDPGCWTRIVSEQKLPAGLAAPDCRAAFARAGSPLDDTAHLSLPAKVDLAEPSLVWRQGRARCEPSP